MVKMADMVCCNRYYKQFLHKHDKLGHPVYFEKIGAINIKQLQKAGSVSHLARLLVLKGY